MTTAPASGGRRVPRVSGDTRQQAILETAERLLETRSLAAISVDDLARGAGISRPTFYFYFSAKEGVLLELLDRMVGEAETRLRSLPRRPVDDPAPWWRSVLQVFVEVFSTHRSVTRTLPEARATSPQVALVWATQMGTWVSVTRQVIEDEQHRGAAPWSLDPGPTAIALNQLNERVLAATLAGEEPAVAEDAVLEVLLRIWLGTIYGSTG